jgi:hypothetical protein
VWAKNTLLLIHVSHIFLRNYATCMTWGHCWSTLLQQWEFRSFLKQCFNSGNLGHHWSTIMIWAHCWSTTVTMTSGTTVLHLSNLFRCSCSSTNENILWACQCLLHFSSELGNPHDLRSLFKKTVATTNQGPCCNNLKQVQVTPWGNQCCICYSLGCPLDVITCDVAWRIPLEFWCAPKSTPF